MSTATNDIIESIVEPVCRAHGLELVQVVQVMEHGGVVLRILIDRDGSERGGSRVTVADCQGVSRDIGPALDVNDAIGGRYRLEVSSPGLDRPLVKLRDFERFAGRKVEVSTRAPQPDGRGGQRRRFHGKLLGVDGADVRLEVDGGERRFPHASIAKANVVHEF